MNSPNKESKSSTSKLDYLSKYTESNETDHVGDDKRERKKRRKKSEERKSSRRRRDDESYSVQVRDIDVGADGAATSDKPLNQNRFKNDYSDDEKDDEDAELPVVVDLENGSTNLPAQETRRGTREEIASTAQPTSTRKRHDSSSSSGEERAASKHFNGSTAVRRRRRHDSDASSNDRHAQPAKTEPASRRRHDSDERADIERKSINHPSSRRRQRHDSDSDEGSEGKRRRHRDESIDDRTASKNRRQKRRHRHDSDEDSADNGDVQRDDRMSSGHLAGMHTGKDFAQTEGRLQQSKREAAQNMVDAHGVGETVHRDRISGRKIPSADNGNDATTASSVQAQRLLNTGRVQLAREEEQRREFASLRESTFARHDDNFELEEMRKQQIRADDPMAAHAAARQRKPTTNNGNTSQPQQRLIYKGPPAKPNRFGILPGHRWDGRDRGNGFEDKLLAQRFSEKYKQEKAYRYSSADM